LKQNNTFEFKIEFKFAISQDLDVSLGKKMYYFRIILSLN